MLINAILIFIIFFFGIKGFEEDMFDDLFKKLKHSNSQKTKNLKYGQIQLVETENYDIKNIIQIKSEIGNDQEMEDTKPNILQETKKETIDDKTDYSMTKITVRTAEKQQLSNELIDDNIDEQKSIGQRNYPSENGCDRSETKSSAKQNVECNEEMELLKNYDLMKKELRREICYKKLPCVKFECEIAKKLGTSRDNIYKLKRKLGQIRKGTVEEEHTKKELIRKFDQLRREKLNGFKYESKKASKIERKIANNLGIARYKIHQWKKETGEAKKFSDEQRIKKIEEFEKIKIEFFKKFHLKFNKKMARKIAEKIGIGFSTISLWRRNFGLNGGRKKIYSDGEKSEFVKKYNKMKNKQMSDEKIAEKLAIDRRSLYEWRKKFGKE